MWFKLFSGGVQKITTWNSNSVQYKTHETKKRLQYLVCAEIYCGPVNHTKYKSLLNSIDLQIDGDTYRYLRHNSQAAVTVRIDTAMDNTVKIAL